MMYHGIVDKKNSETDYIGGNVDKDGYTRTSEAFRQDLELYYEKGYRMIRISDYIEGKIDVPYGYSPIILTFDDGNANNLKVTGLDEKGNAWRWKWRRSCFYGRGISANGFREKAR